jgi:putative FmdB family regulatory protein
MPTYEYICGKCGHEFEAVRSMSAKPLRICPEDLCGQKKWGHGKVKKKISAGAGLLFKGSGFYITDYRSQKYKDAAKKDSAPAKTPASDAKPAAKSETKTAKMEKK